MEKAGGSSDEVRDMAKKVNEARWLETVREGRRMDFEEGLGVNWR